MTYSSLSLTSCARPASSESICSCQSRKYPMAMMPTSRATSSIALGAGGQAPGSRVLRFLNWSRNFFIGSGLGRRRLGRCLAGLAGIVGREALQADVHLEFRDALV